MQGGRQGLCAAVKKCYVLRVMWKNKKYLSEEKEGTKDEA